jgi:hypothetical protein
MSARKKTPRVQVGASNAAQGQRAQLEAAAQERVRERLGGGAHRDAFLARKNALQGREAFEELRRCVDSRAKDARALFLTHDIGLKGHITMDEFVAKVTYGERSKLTKSQLCSLLKIVPGPGGEDSFDYLRFAKIVNTISGAAPEPQRPSTSEPLIASSSSSSSDSSDSRPSKSNNNDDEVANAEQKSEKKDSASGAAAADSASSGAIADSTAQSACESAMPEAAGGARAAVQDSSRSVAYREALQRVRDKLVARKVALEPSVRRSENVPNYVLEKWVRSNFAATKTVLEYDALLEAVDRLGADLDPADVRALLVATDGEQRGFLTVPRLLTALLREDKPNKEEPLAGLRRFCAHAEKELSTLRRRHAELHQDSHDKRRRAVDAKSAFFAEQPHRQALIPSLRRGMRKDEPHERFAPFMADAGTEVSGNARLMTSRRQARSRLYASGSTPELALSAQRAPSAGPGNEESAEPGSETPGRRPMTSLCTPLARVTRRSSTPADLDSRPRVGFGTGGVVPDSAHFMPEHSRLQTTFGCAYLPPKTASAGVLEFSAGLEAGRRRACFEATCRRKHHAEAVTFNSLAMRAIGLDMEDLARSHAKAQQRIHYLAGVIEADQSRHRQ